MPIPSSPSSAAAPPGALPMKAVVAVVVGNFLEFYDFLVFTFFAVMIGDAFFPGDSQIGRLLGALATFGVGFVTRPLGAAIIGPYADRVGRRAALTLTLLLMSVGSLMIALTPSYAQIGIAAPVLLVLARLIQGFSCGGEVGPATTYLLEAAPPEKRAALTAWQAYSQQIAAIVGAGIGLILAATLTRDALYAWGWRIPFLLGVLIAPVAFYIRRQLPETIAEAQTHRSTAAVLGELWRGHSRAVTFGVLIICGGTVSTYVLNYMTTYAITTLNLSATVANMLGLTNAVAQIAGLAVGVWLDRLGRKRMLILSRVAFVLIVSPVYLILTSPDASLAVIVICNLFLGFVYAIGIGAAYAFMAEAFPQSVRSSGLAILYALGVMIFGGTTQFVVAWLIDVTGNPMVPAWYQIVATSASIVGVTLMTPHAEVLRERAIRAEVRA
ncbi:MAG TPA: MFS transporter [Vicinamibacterales bacterium]|nr:MFS transporter [Vicinamibacterales bacterium]